MPGRFVAIFLLCSATLLVCSATLPAGQQDQSSIRAELENRSEGALKAAQALIASEPGVFARHRDELFAEFRKVHAVPNTSWDNTYTNMEDLPAEDALTRIYSEYMKAKLASLSQTDLSTGEIHFADFNPDYLSETVSHFQPIAFGAYRPSRITTTVGERDWAISPGRSGNFVAPAPERETMADDEVWRMEVESRDRRLAWTVGKNSLQPFRVLDFGIDPAVTDLQDYGVITVSASPPETDVYLNNQYHGAVGKASFYHPVGRVEILLCKDGYKPQEETVDLAERQIHLIDVELERDPENTESGSPRSFFERLFGFRPPCRSESR